MTRAQVAVKRRPTTAAGTLAAAVVVIARKAGVELSAEEAVSLVAALLLIVGYFTPREA